MGHVLFVPSQVMMHVSWNSWWHGICFSVAPTSKTSRQIEQVHLGSAAPYEARASTCSSSVRQMLSSPRRNVPCVGFRCAGASSMEAVMELSSWSSKVWLMPVSLWALIQFWVACPRRNWMKLLPQRAHWGARSELSGKKMPHSKQNAWSWTLPGGLEDVSARSPSAKRLGTPPRAEPEPERASGSRSPRADPWRDPCSPSLAACDSRVPPEETGESGE
mmetsp:Transcript_43369/g.114721  ORF Transcript_43369/g.114721 Transcript_43369/m.114721 type:complete len:219 (-) Transcript_43369:259-915(-)